MANNSQIKLTGLIPISNPNYASNYEISDNNYGKYISLNGTKKFYNPGIDLTLSQPLTAATTSTNTLINNFYPNNVTALLNSPTKGDCAFFVYLDTMNPIGNIPGFVNNLMTINNASTPNLLNLQSVISQGNIRILNVLQDGTYTINFQLAGNVSESSISAFHMDFAFYLNINGIETLLSPVVTTNTNYVGGATDNLLVYNFNITGYSGTFNLNSGDYVQLYGKGISNYYGMSVNVNILSGSLSISQSYSTTPANSVFTNPLNIKDFNIPYINFYGANRDTLILQGNILTS